MRVYYAVATFLILLLVYEILSKKILFLIVLSGSMQPLLNPGDVAIIKKTNFEDVDIGDVITFREKNNFITHRVIDIKGEELKTKGDANEDPDKELVSRDNFYGKMIFVIPYLGLFAHKLKSRDPYAYVTFILLPSLFIIISEIKNIRKYRPSLERKEIKKSIFKKRFKKRIRKKAFTVYTVLFIILSYLIVYENVLNFKEIVYVNDTVNYRVLEKGESIEGELTRIPYIIPINWFLVLCSQSYIYAKHIFVLIFYALTTILAKPILFETVPHAKKYKKL